MATALNIPDKSAVYWQANAGDVASGWQSQKDYCLSFFVRLAKVTGQNLLKLASRWLLA